jgi:predicted CXXCH cytochrome family protein
MRRLHYFSRLSLLIFFTFLFVSSAIAYGQQSSTSGLPSVREADAVCAKCHLEIYRKYLSTPMANASGRALERPIIGSFFQKSSDTTYRISLADGSLWLSLDKARDPARHQRYELAFFLGSGHLGVTYLYSINGYLLESPVAYYSRLNAYDMKPGLTDLATVPPALPMKPGCMRCHMSQVQREDSGTGNHYSGLPFFQGGISCESCHGDTKEHVRTAGKAALINPAKLDHERRDSICISCHLEGDASVEHRGRQISNYRPGERISDYVTYFVYAKPDQNSRGVSEIEELSLSKCKRVSGDQMSCMSCHDPHFSPAKQERADYYRRRCLSCHTQPKYSTAHYSTTPDCTSCHMPTGKSQDVPHVAWTDHRIRQRADQLTLSDPTNAGPELLPFLPGGTNPRDLAIAYYNVSVNGIYSLQHKAGELLAAVNRTEPPDGTVLADLGYLAQSKGQTSEAIAFYLEALKLDPHNLQLANNLGALWFNRGQTEAALALWEKSFDLNEDVESLGVNLASGECKLGRLDKAESVLKRVLIYNSDNSLATQRLQSFLTDPHACSFR